MSEIKSENVYKEENSSRNTNHKNSKNSKNSKIDISPILKDVERCIKSGLDDRLQSFFYEFETYENTHNEVFNLTVVKNLVRHNNVLTRVINKSVCKRTYDDDEESGTEYDFSKKSELNILKQEVVYLRQELTKYKKLQNELEDSSIKLEIKDFNIWNSQSWWFSIKTGDIILFPSSLTHMVETKEGTNTRISLAFNVFIKGTIGDNKLLTELILK